ncbi:MAG: hypothetical protein ACHQK8_08130, partial [Bacteroidia bacterium]
MKKNIRGLLLIFLLMIVAQTKVNAQQKLIHYWHFNNLLSPAITPVNPATLPAIKAGYSSLDTNKSFIYYKTLPGTSSAYQTYYDATTGDTVNSRKSQAAGNCMRTRNPSDSMQLVFNIPTTSYQNITIKYEVQRSGAVTGSPAHFYDYSIDSGTTWRTFGLTATTDSTGYGAWTFCNTSIADLESFNNKRLLFRIRFAGPTNFGTIGFNKIDNFTIEGDTFVSMNPPLYNIIQINHTNPITGSPDSLNAKATVRGVVYGFNQKTTANGYQFCIKDQTGAITIFHATKNYGYTVSEGDSVQVNGTVSVFRGLTEIVPDSIIRLANGRTLASPTLVTQLNQTNESNLVKISNLVFYNNPIANFWWPTNDTTFICHTLGQNDTVTLHILPTSGIAGTPLPITTTFSVTGLETQVSSSLTAPFASNGYQILPRYAADVVNGVTLPDVVSNVSVSSLSSTSLSISWNKPATYVDSTMSTLMFLKSGSMLNTGVPNKKYSSYLADPNFAGTGTLFQYDSLARCMMNSDSNYVNISGLNQGITYYATIFVVRKNDSTYSLPVSVPASTLSTQPMPVTSLLMTGQTGTSAKITWTKPAVYN